MRVSFAVAIDTVYEAGLIIENNQCLAIVRFTRVVILNFAYHFKLLKAYP